MFIIINYLLLGTFLVVDCGGGTVDLTIRRLLSDGLGEVTIRTGGLCGSTYIDREFIKFLVRKLGFYAINNLKEHHYGQYQILINEFCRNVKLPFTGIKEEYKTYELDIKVNLKNLFINIILLYIFN
jgi:molecular chaperone DnaK (HSP70)